ncbi:MAG: hypothetical protein EOP24_33715 [Hyphomicrobiales bacterium]|nr:MAG: hypothetical protein EOP24_33715 [Hyphomicrobiales bacterium]
MTKISIKYFILLRELGMIDLGETMMSGAEIDAYLRADGRFAAVCSMRRDGSPFAIPLGYYYDGECLYFSTTPTRGVAKRLRRDGRISVCIFDHEAIHGYVLVNGVAEEIEDPGDHYSLAMHHRYPKPGVDPEEHDAIWLSEGRVVFRVSTENAFGMDQRKATSVHALAMPDLQPTAQAARCRLTSTTVFEEQAR